MKNHKWKDNICVRCGLKREKKYWEKHYALLDRPPWDAYIRGVSFYYTTQEGINFNRNRPNCINHEQTHD